MRLTDDFLLVTPHLMQAMAFLRYNKTDPSFKWMIDLSLFELRFSSVLPVQEGTKRHLPLFHCVLFLQIVICGCQVVTMLLFSGNVQLKLQMCY